MPIIAVFLLALSSFRGFGGIKAKGLGDDRRSKVFRSRDADAHEIATHACEIRKTPLISMLASGH
jgi:hypothetical protein